MPCPISFLSPPVTYRNRKLLPYSISFFNLSTIAHIWSPRLFKLLGFLFHQFFGPPKNVIGPSPWLPQLAISRRGVLMMLEVKGPTDNVHIHPGEGGGRPGSGGIKEHQVHYWQPLCTTSKYPGNIKNIKILRFYSRGCRIFIFRVVN